MHGDFADNLADGWLLNGCPSMSRQDSGTRSPLSLSGFLTPTITPICVDHGIFHQVLSALLSKVEENKKMFSESTHHTASECEKDPSTTSNSASHDGSSGVHQIHETMKGMTLSDEAASAAPASRANAKMETMMMDLPNISSHMFLQGAMTPPRPSVQVTTITPATKAKKRATIVSAKSVNVQRKSQRLQDRTNKGLAPRFSNFKRG
jgi:hypothetical protein